MEAVTLGTAVAADYAITRPATTFAPSQHTIYASVATRGSSDRVTLSAQLRYLEGKGRDVVTISRTLAIDGPATTVFKLHNPDNWPAGRYRIAIAIDGKLAYGATFEVTGA